MYSMTGYGKGIAAKNGRKLTLELKSVNHRFLDLSFKMPRGYNQFEDIIRKSLQSELVRGHIDVFFNIEDNRIGSAVTLNTPLALRYLELAKELESLGYHNDLSVYNAIKIDGMFSTFGNSVDAEDDLDIAEMVSCAVKEAVSNLKSMRKTEGELLIEDISKKLDIIQDLLAIIVNRAPLVAQEYKEKLSIRITNILNNIPLDQNLLANEVCVFVDKCNIDEEIIRLKAHLAHYKKIINQKEPIGKKLDFLTQECNREVNTIGSKSNDIIITENVMKLKNEIEKIREQIQNIE